MYIYKLDIWWEKNLSEKSLKFDQQKIKLAFFLSFHCFAFMRELLLVWPSG